MYLGNQPALSYTSFAKQDFTTSATTSYTLSQPVANENEIALFINFVRQEPTTAYTASGTSLTLTSATSASDDMYAIFLGKAVQTVNPPAGSVGTSQLANGAVTSAKLDSGVALGKVLQVVSATDGTQRSTTSTSFVTASNTLSVTLTPVSTSSRVFITMSSAGLRTSGATGSVHYTIYRDATNLGDATAGMSLYYASESANDWGFPLAMSITDSPNTTSSITYQVYMKTTNASNTARLQQYPVLGTITAMEIAG